MRRGDEWSVLTLANLSTTGLMAKCPSPPQVGSEVEIRHRGVCIRGEVVWATRTRFGLRSFEPIDLTSLLAKGGLQAIKADRIWQPKRRWWNWHRKD